MLFVTGCLDRFLHLPRQLTKKSAFTYATGEEEHNRIITSLDALSKDIRSIDDLPLKIDSVKGLSPAFCYSEVSVLFASQIILHSNYNRYVYKILNWRENE